MSTPRMATMTRLVYSDEAPKLADEAPKLADEAPKLDEPILADDAWEPADNEQSSLTRVRTRSPNCGG